MTTVLVCRERREVSVVGNGALAQIDIEPFAGGQWSHCSAEVPWPSIAETTRWLERRTGDERYASGYDSLSWHQAEPAMSLQLLELVGTEPGEAVIDIGGGASLLVDRLVQRGHSDVTVLDVSPRALDAARRRLGAGAALVKWIEADITAWEPDQEYRMWHDRAVFHFLVDADDRARYVEVLDATVRRGGTIVVATFAPDGPARCSGLRVRRYSDVELASAFGPGWRLAAARREEHMTPAGIVQPFTWVVLRRG